MWNCECYSKGFFQICCFLKSSVLFSAGSALLSSLIVFTSLFQRGSTFPYNLRRLEAWSFYSYFLACYTSKYFTYYMAARIVGLSVFYIIRARFHLLTGSLELKYANIVHLTFTSFNSKEFVIS